MVGSVCTGSLLLGAAGLLKGRRATSHWQTLELLKEVGATPVTERVVFDGTDRVTAAGVSAGLDLGFQLVRHYRGDFYAKGMELLGEYDPQPPFPGGGNPRTADKTAVEMLNMMHAPIVEKFREVIQTVKTKSRVSKATDQRCGGYFASLRCRDRRSNPSNVPPAKCSRCIGQHTLDMLPFHPVQRGGFGRKIFRILMGNRSPRNAAST